MAQRNYYVVGNTVRAEAPARAKERQVSSQAMANRERSLQMNMGYVVFLAAAAVLTVMICVNYLRLQARYTSLQKESTTLETTLGSLRIDNDEAYNRIISSVNLEEVKATAIEKLGMVYASEDQIETYEAATRDYVKQYKDIP